MLRKQLHTHENYTTSQSTRSDQISRSELYLIGSLEK